MRKAKIFNSASPSSLDNMEATIVFDGNMSNTIKNRRRAGTEDSVDTAASSSSSRKCLADALKDSEDFHFDMSDRWRTALMESMDQPMFPDDEHVPRHRRLRKGVTNFVKNRAQGLRRDSRRDSRRDMVGHQPAPPVAML
ncbi:MAG: hypothetical protein SGBAC_006094 [Bacillariaceae sp.]